MSKVNKMMSLLAACGVAGGIAGAASAGVSDSQGKVVVLSGATLLNNFVTVRACYVDFIDVDGDGIARGIPNSGTNIDQLAPFSLPTTEGVSASIGQSSNLHWNFFYRSSGSGNGFSELRDVGRGWFTGGDSTSGFYPRRDTVYWNRYRFISGGANVASGTNPEGGALGALANTGNGSAFPIRAVRNDIGANDITKHFNATYSFPNTASTSPTVPAIDQVAGLTIDVAILDVPTFYFARGSSTPPALPERDPGAGGYGQNSRSARSPGGAAAVVNSVLFPSATGSTLTSTTITEGAPSDDIAGVGSPSMNFNVSSPDNKTIFDTPLFFAPVAPIINFGTGLQGIGGKPGILMTDLQYLCVSGRLSSGENLVQVVRDAGSGTRNSYQNSIGIDPSWGVGENVGNRSSLLNLFSPSALGNVFVPGNKGANEAVEQTVYNHRLAIGYVGPERGLRNNAPNIRWLSGGQCDIISVANNLPNYGNSLNYVRPTLDAILGNDVAATRWVIGGPAALATYGNPKAARPEKGGEGWMEPFQDVGPDGMENTLDVGEGDDLYQVGEPYNDINNNLVRDAVETRNPAFDLAYGGYMRNEEAAAWVNNIARSIQAFASIPTDPDPNANAYAFFTPGEYAAQNFILSQAQPFGQTLSNPTLLVSQGAAYSAALRSYINPTTGGVDDGRNVQDDPAYATFGTGVAPVGSNSPAGKVPSRKIAGEPFNDSNLNGAYDLGEPFDDVGLDGYSSTSSPDTGENNGVYDTATNIYSDAAFNARGSFYTGWGTDGTNGTQLRYATITNGAQTGINAQNLPIANMIAGDFNADGRRNWLDADGIVGAWRARNSLPGWAPPVAPTLDLLAIDNAVSFNYNQADFCIEIVGDFDGNGSYDLKDVRYFADGLAMDPVSGKLNRSEGFKRVDQASQTAGGSVNFFGTILGNGATVANNINNYVAGYSSADVAGSGLEARGFAPVGADGRVSGADIDFVFAQLRAVDNKGNLIIDGGEIDWATEQDEAAFTDLSADVNGDLKINIDDVRYIVNTVLCTNFGDVNLDGVVDATDLVGLPALNSAATWATGDMTGDGLYTSTDNAIITGNAGLSRPCCPLDHNSDGVIDVVDLFAFLDDWFAVASPKADFDRDGDVDVVDLFDYLDGWFANNGTNC